MGGSKHLELTQETETASSELPSLLGTRVIRPKTKQNTSSGPGRQSFNLLGKYYH